MGELLQRQMEFTELSNKLIAQAVAMGYRVTYGETLRAPATAAENAARGAGIARSNHIIGLAIDLHLFLPDGDGFRYLQNTPDYKPLGDWWKQQHALARWGGDWVTRQDGNHFSFVWHGVE